MVEVRKTALPGVIEIVPRKFEDDRGFFSETYNRPVFQAAGVNIDFVQDNQSLSRSAGVVRGLHYQLPPHPQAKLVRVLRGSIFDVAVDIRKGSPTYARWVGVELSAKSWNQLLIPAGFAHGFITLEPDSEVAYKTSDVYAPTCDRAIRFDDPTIGIVWPFDLGRVILSPKDAGAPSLAEAETFQFQAGES